MTLELSRSGPALELCPPETVSHCGWTGDGPVYRDILIDCHVVPALLARICPDTPVRRFPRSSPTPLLF